MQWKLLLLHEGEKYPFLLTTDHRRFVLCTSDSMVQMHLKPLCTIILRVSYLKFKSYRDELYIIQFLLWRSFLTHVYTEAWLLHGSENLDSFMAQKILTPAWLTSGWRPCTTFLTIFSLAISSQTKLSSTLIQSVWEDILSKLQLSYNNPPQ